MYGAILGDIVGSVYEFDRSPKTKDFPLFSPGCKFTDDSVMTIAVCEAVCEQAIRLDSYNIPLQRYFNGDPFTDEEIKKRLVGSMKKWGKAYPGAGYGDSFIDRLENGSKPYNSFGNGSAMRVSSIGWLFDDLDQTRKIARLSAEVTHNHPEGIKGAESVASAIYLARTGSSKEDIKEYIVREFGYDLTRSCDQIRPSYHHVESCQETVPEAITAFLESDSFEDAIRTAISLGGDSDTLTCIAGSIAEAYYPIPVNLIGEVERRLPEDINDALRRFRRERIISAAEAKMKDLKIDSFKNIEEYADCVLRSLMFEVYHYDYKCALKFTSKIQVMQQYADEGNTASDTAIFEGYVCG
jgi:ADP-ribosylglycohydrolase